MLAFQSLNEMYAASAEVTVGQLAFVELPERLYLRISSGWREILVRRPSPSG